MAEMRDYEDYFRRADLDKDGKISYDEAISFLKNFGLQQEVVEEIWRSSKLSRGDFMHALRLVTTVQKATGLTLDQIKPFVASNVEPTRHGLKAAAISAPKFIEGTSSFPTKGVGPAVDDHCVAQSLMDLSAAMAVSMPPQKSNELSKKKTCQGPTLADSIELREAKAMHEGVRLDLLSELERKELVLQRLESDKRLMRFNYEEQFKKLEELLEQRKHENTEGLKKTNGHIMLLEGQLSEYQKRCGLLQSKHDEQVRLLQEQDNKYDRLIQERDLAVAVAEVLSQKIDQERNYDRLLQERDLAVAEAEVLHQKRGQMLAVLATAMHREFSPSALQDATENYSWIIGEGAFGCVYRGDLRGLTVAVKKLKHHNLEERSQFEQETTILSMVRHPHLIALLGACAESYILVYEFMSGGSLEGFLKYRDNRRILTWQIRIRIIAEICSALIFLHKNEPHPIVHGDIKAANVLLDDNLKSKISDFGLAHVLIQCSKNNTNLHQTINPKGTIGYVDPEYARDGVLTCQSDVYSFGVLIMHIFTGMPVVDTESNVHISTSVSEAMNQNNLRSIVDTTAGEWPDDYIFQLAFLALRCTNMLRKDRPDLLGELWKPIKAMWAATELPSDSYSISVRDENQRSGRNR